MEINFASDNERKMTGCCEAESDDSEQVKKHKLIKKDKLLHFLHPALEHDQRRRLVYKSRDVLQKLKCYIWYYCIQDRFQADFTLLVFYLYQ